MISKFNLYIIKLFAKYTIIVQIFVAIISLVANTFQHTKYLSEYNITFTTLLIFDFLKTPYLLYSTMPMTIVISTMFVMITLLKNNELLAYVSLGGKIRNLAVPFIIGGALMSVLLFVMADSLNPKVMFEREKFASEHIRKKRFVIQGKLTDLWLKENDRTFVSIGIMDPENRLNTI
jgi:lipopolysaccharide export system permease protein